MASGPLHHSPLPTSPIETYEWTNKFMLANPPLFHVSAPVWTCANQNNVPPGPGLGWSTSLGPRFPEPRTAPLQLSLFVLTAG